MTELKLSQCSFCGSHKSDVKKLIVSEDVAICNNCVELCNQLITEDKKTQESETSIKPSIKSFDARDIMNHLNTHVIGQSKAKQIISVAIANHYKRIHNPPKNQDLTITKGNVLCVGPTGSGKTLLAKTVAKYLNVPFIVADATTLTEAGYVGDDVESMISMLLTAANDDVSLAEQGIVFIDEIDKIARRGDSSAIAKDVSGEGVQQALLKLIEGSKCRVPAIGKRKNPNNEMIEVDTSNILFIAGGSFVGVEKLVGNRIRGSSIGFDAKIKSKESTEELSLLSPEDLINFGMLPELMGRFSTIVALDTLSVDELVLILSKAKNNYIQQYKHLLKVDGIKLKFTRSALKLIAQNCIDLKIGARGLQSELERVLLPHMFYVSKYLENDINEINISTDLVNNPRSLTQCCTD